MGFQHTYYYNCNRSHYAGMKHISNSEHRERVEKSQGSSKLQFLCTSQIKVAKKNDKVYVKYYKTHYQHKIEVQHLRIDKQDRINIANKLNAGVLETKILDQNRSDFSEGRDVKRRHLLTRKVVIGNFNLN